MRLEFKGIHGVSSKDNTGLTSIRIERDGLEGEVFLHGTHVTSWKPSEQNEDVLFLSRNSQFTSTKAIRGGVPICFPWFGPRPGLPQHGFARTRAWQLDGVSEKADAIVVELSDRADEQTREVWPFDFVAKHRIVFGSTLRMELQVENAGDQPFQFEEAQHTYFRVGDVREISIAGLEGVTYVSQAESGQSRAQNGAIRFTNEVDRAYLNTSYPITLDDPTTNRRITVRKSNSNSTVVWNPWIEKAGALSDLGADQWQQMVCIETCNIHSNAISLAPGERHMMTTEIAVTKY